jgi:pantoate--beta-alanine ligase
MQVVTTPEELALLPSQQSRAVVMTMGALHAGHGSLMEVARREVGSEGLVLVTIFVNPLQFGANEDFDRYPRTIDADLDLCRSMGVDVVFVPEREAIYPDGVSVTVDPGPLGDILEGAERVGHFRGVLTVVAKLLNLTRANVAVFGEKDYQQLTLIAQMARDLVLPVRIVAGPTIRESDGLAMSSRNRFLSTEQRAAAAGVFRALNQAAHVAPQGPEAMRKAGLEELGDATVDYFTVTSTNLGPVIAGEQGRILVAVNIGDVRLIDNIAVAKVGS